MVNLRKSSFLVRLKATKSGFFVYNTITKKTYFIQSSWNRLLSKAQEKSSLKKQLIDSMVLTKERDYRDELIKYLNFKEKSNQNNLTIYITVTTKCDLECSYCFENHIKRIDIKKTINLKLNKLLDGKLKNDPRIKTVNISLFGGEPALRIDLCAQFIDSIKETCFKHKVKCLFSMTSNGIILKKREMKILKKKGLSNLQVSFDGSASMHNAIRELNNNGGYRALLKQAKWLQRMFNLTLKYNIRKQNVDDFGCFLKDLKKEGINKVEIKLEALQPTITDNQDQTYFNPQDKLLPEVYYKLGKKTLDSGYRLNLNSTLEPPCMVSAENSFMIDPKGNVSACVSAYEIPELFLGNISRIKNLSFERIKIKASILRAASSKCIRESCSYFPVCETGCSFMKIINKRNLNDVYCRKKYFDRLIPLLAKLDSQ